MTPWRSPLARALHLNRRKPYSRYFQLATVQTDGKPANRTVVFRGFLDDSDRLKMITDARSAKIHQIQQQAWGEICWYFTETREQFRIAGTLLLVSNTHPDPQLQKHRQLTWQDLSDNARIQFAWPHPKQERSNLEAFAPPPPNPNQPPAEFCLLLLDPVSVDRLELRGDPQNRTLYQYGEATGWSETAVNP
ncbi:pyridoxamine 5'-phosphate oxidase family protein [Desertifilum sp. FACHB-1129]|uniref:Pyridoxamine 5'-phosphate oxidase n=1 Tax=Desertifilum tharense IPPAS B-1220 TaxID=1781255 RepID=A0A1E5QI96_9CYAN|nr:MULTISPECIES: Npun_F5749 family FMN-dependent PPOX-type flavoprotein [Desertifilum]MCD8489994.1 pyridoxamine 5'-phosphate oxidase family protein [Desertifilum sp.]MDA0212056.1 pyridoxamine 5'-phosphate oxidase family protein [Cyanobacteria bacterium FC1]MBD2314419.1 pyridoxamine 5'-phosphate oxidase family protein [Desertifilum sp. FACHB-1129]MBD2324886.1 pyridoxamine 5'-phosphate oxidase family protein [Desertifilum sp. FACHB-866]MBD2334978.1 pyridoxamine 5'-phosphate oxidase family protei